MSSNRHAPYKSAPGLGQHETVPKAIGSLAKKQEDKTRLGMTRMKFVPTLPVRRKKEMEMEEKDASQIESGQERGGPQGHDGGRGNGRTGRRGVPSRPAQEMVASGPFALGPSMAGSSSSSQRTTSRSNFAPRGSRSSSATPGAGLTRPGACTIKPENDDHMAVDQENYSDPDEGVEIIDINEIKRMDYMAPESLQKERKLRKKSKNREKLINPKAEPMEIDLKKGEQAAVGANALDLSESEEDEKIEEGLFEDFTLQEEEFGIDANARCEKLYFFQFPEPFPRFVAPQTLQRMDVDATSAKIGVKVNVEVKDEKGKIPEKTKSVSFASDVKPPTSGFSTPVPEGVAMPEEQNTKALDGVIGRLELHQSGVVRIRLENGILLDVAAASQPHFLQHAVHVDMSNKRFCVLGEVNRRFTVSPNIDALLEQLEISESKDSMKLGS